MSRQCKGSWIKSYLDYTQGQESPTAFHEWVGLSVLSATIGRHAWMRRVKYTIFPNLFIILVAGSGKCRKSTAIEIGMNILGSIKHPPMIFAQKITAEALIQALELAKVDGSSSGLVCAKELSTFMGQDATKSGIIPALTDLYDSPKEWVYHTRGRGKEILRNVTISILAASTPEWLKTSIPSDAVGGGFTSRILFIRQEKPSRPILFEESEGWNTQLEAALIADLNTIRKNIKGPMEFTPEAREVANIWYKKELATVRDSKLDGYFSRKHDTMFKIASLLSIAESNNRNIDHTHINKALSMLEENEKNLGEIIASVVASAIGGDTEKILDLVKRYKRIQHSDLLRHCWRFATADQVNTMVRTLIESNEIEEQIATDKRTRFYVIKQGR